ncbi:hypothetical protein WJX72_000659 [[Myrmecia] bisecta]|uniref:VHS domain-containing protein n=1 Tax=[Myrmecia] bisecta TaxID=41462 RepID=A0AAW1R441_9CHLO
MSSFLRRGRSEGKARTGASQAKMQPAAILDWAGVVELVQAVQQQDSLRDSEIGALVKQRLKINSVAVLLNTLTILDAIAINCSEAVRCELADKKWMKRLGQACTERGMTPAAPAVLQLLANWTHTFEGEELALSAQAAAVAKLGRIPQPSSLAYQLRELVEQQTPLVGFQRGSDFMATFLNSPQLNSPQLSRSSAGTSSPLQSGRAAASGQANTAPAAPPSLMQKQAGFSGPNSHWVVARLSDMRMQAASLDEVEGVCRAAAEALERHQPPACADLDAAVAHGWNLAKACNMHCLEVKRMVSSDLADDVLGQALAVNDRFNAVLQAWEATSARIAVIQTSPTRQPTVADPPAGQAGRSTSGDQSSQLSGGATPQTGSRPAPDAAPLIDLSPPEPTRPAEASAASADQADAIMNLEDDFSLWGDGETVPGGAQQGKAQQGGAQQQQQEARASSAGSASSLERPSMEAQALDATAPAQRQPSTAQRLGSCNSGTPSTSFSHDRQPLPFEDFASFAHAQRSGSLAESDSAEFATISFADFSRTRKAGDAGSQAAESGVAASPWTIAQRGSDHQPASSPWTVAQRGTPGSAAPAQQSAPMAQQSAPDQEPACSPWTVAQRGTPGFASSAQQVEVLQAKVKALQAQVEEAAQRHAQQMDAVRAKHAQEAAAHAETMAQLKGQAVTKLRNLMQQVEQLKGQQQQLEQQKAQRERELELRLEEAMQAEDSLVSELRAVRLQLGAKDDQIHALQQQQQQQQLFGDFDPFGNGSRRGASHDGFSPFAASSVGASPFADGWASTSGRATPAAAAAVPRPQLAASSEEMARRYARFDALLTKSAHSAPISDAALRAYYRQPALRLRFTPAQFLQMTGRMTAGK